MIFGLPERFAVESIIYQRSPKYLFGHLRFWISGQPIGEFRQNLVLETPTLCIWDFLARPGPRNHFSLDGKSNEEILRIFHWTLSSDGEASAEEKAHLKYRKFDDIYRGCELCPSLSASFDGSEAVLLEEEGQDRIIWKAFGQNKTQKVVLHTGECLSALESFVDWFACGCL